MAEIKPLEQSADKWSRRASVAGPDYQAGVTGKSALWEAQAKKQEGAYKEGVTKAAAAGRYGKGVTGQGSKWQDMCMRKGTGRYPEGVNIGEPFWRSGFAPYQDAIKGLPLPPRGPRRSPANLQRVAAVMTTLGNLYERIKGG